MCLYLRYLKIKSSLLKKRSNFKSLNNCLCVNDLQTAISKTLHFVDLSIDDQYLMGARLGTNYMLISV